MRSENDEKQQPRQLGTPDYLLGGGCALVVLAAGLLHSVLGLFVAGVVLIGGAYVLARREPHE
jgi:hypothetical protein